VVVPRYKVVTHTADSAIIAYGVTLPELFENAAFGMFDLVFDFAELGGGEELEEVVEGADSDNPELLVAWLNQLLFLAETQRLAFYRFRIVHLEPGKLEGTAAGVSSNGLELRSTPIKAVTYHDLAIVEDADGFSVRIIFDV